MFINRRMYCYYAGRIFLLDPSYYFNAFLPRLCKHEIHKDNVRLHFFNSSKCRVNRMHRFCSIKVCAMGVNIFSVSSEKELAVIKDKDPFGASDVDK